MHWRTVARVLLVAILLTTSGCAGLMEAEPPTPTETTPNTAEPTQTTTTPVDTRALVNVTEGSLAYDANRTWRRVAQRFGTNVSPPTVRVAALEDSGGQYRSGVIVIPPWNNGNAERDVLAHEMAHHVLHEGNPWAGRYTESQDEQFANRGFDEGFASWVQSWFAERYQNEDPTWELPTETPEVRYQTAQYVLGKRYVAYRLNHTAELGSVLEGRWPNTSEQLLHPERGFEQPKSLTVRASNASRHGRTAYIPIRRPLQLGEMAVRVTIWTRLNASAAKRAGTGWANDTLRTFQGPGGDGHVWTIRYDNETAAAAAARLFDAYHDGDRPSFPEYDAGGSQFVPSDRFVTAFWRPPSNRSLRTQLIENETLVVFAGPESFVTNADALGTAGNVTIRVVNESRENSTVPSTERQNKGVSDLARGGVEPPGSSGGWIACRDGACGVLA